MSKKILSAVKTIEPQSGSSLKHSKKTDADTVSAKLLDEAATALAAKTPGVSKSTITELMNHAMQSETQLATEPDTDKLLKDIVESTAVQAAIEATADKVKPAEKASEGGIWKNPLPGAYGHSDGKPYSGLDYRGITYNKELLDKINDNILSDFGNAEAFAAAKNAEARTNYYPYIHNVKKPVAIANATIFDAAQYTAAINGVFYHSTDPNRPAYNELTIMPSIINKIHHYERIHGTADVLSPSARQAFIMGCLLNDMNGSGLSYIGELAGVASYPSEMGISETEAMHILALVNTLGHHRSLDKIIRKIRDSDKTVAKIYEDVMTCNINPIGSDYYTLTNAMRKAHVLKRIVTSLVPEGVMRDVIAKRKPNNNYTAKIEASARLRRASINYIEGGSFGDLLVAIGSFSIVATKEYQEVIATVDCFFSYLSNNDIKFTDVYENTKTLHDKKFSKLGRYNYGDDFEDGSF